MWPSLTQWLARSRHTSSASSVAGQYDSPPPPALCVLCHIPYPCSQVGKAIDIVAAKLDVSHRVDEANGKVRRPSSSHHETKHALVHFPLTLVSLLQDRWWLMPLESDVPFHPRSKLGDLSSSDGDGDGSVMPGDEIRFVKGPLTDDDIVKQVTE